MATSELNAALDRLDDARAALARHRRIWRTLIGCSILTVLAVISSIALIYVHPEGSVLSNTGGVMLGTSLFVLVGLLVAMTVRAFGPDPTHDSHPARRVVLAQRAHRDLLDQQRQASRDLPASDG
jgi:hypothetical protein